MPQNPLISNPNERLRDLESKYSILAEHILVVNKNIVEDIRENLSDMGRINQELKEIKAEMEKLKLAMKSFVRQTELFARKDELKILEKYINLWNPMDFVTTSELDNALKNKRGEAHSRKKPD